MLTGDNGSCKSAPQTQLEGCMELFVFVIHAIHYLSWRFDCLYADDLWCS